MKNFTLGEHIVYTNTLVFRYCTVIEIHSNHVVVDEGNGLIERVDESNCKYYYHIWESYPINGLFAEAQRKYGRR